MPITSQDELQAKITWTHKHQGLLNTIRVGTLNGRFFSQLVVNGLPMASLYPPREISQRLYDELAKGSEPIS